MKLLVGLVTLCFLGLAACPPSPGPVPPTPDATDAVAPPTPAPVGDSAPTPPPPVSDAAPPANACTAACANAKALGCPEGAYADCSNTCSTVLADPHQPHANLAAIAAAKTKADVHAAGWTCK
jgi:hypothetical protein